jgi:hypothetical protein
VLAELFAWIHAHLTLSAVAATATTACGALTKKSWDRRSDRRSEYRRTREALYAEMADNLARLIFLASPRSPVPPFAQRHPGYQEKIGLHGVTFPSLLYQELRSKAIFREIPEASSIEDFYGWLKRIQSPLPSDSVVVLFREAVDWTAHNAREGQLDASLLTRQAPAHAREDVRRITSESREWLYEHWLNFGAS